MADIHGIASFPAIFAVESAQYSVSHGISPGVCILKVQVQDTLPAEFGDLVITDGNETILVPDCKVNAVKVERDDKGFFWLVEIVDRRWRWKTLGSIAGTYNQLNEFGKLIPWTIRSPSELATLCLEALGETDYVINLPPGINYPGPNVSEAIDNISGVNPPVHWDNIPPAQALQHLADKFGCRVVYQLGTDSVYVGPVGVGAPLPDGSIHRATPSLLAPLAPDGVGVIGSPTRYQVRLLLQAVGEDWDTRYRPLDELSYAPLAGGLPQKDAITVGNLSGTNNTYTLTMTDALTGGKQTESIQTTHTGTTLFTDLAGLINGSGQSLFELVTATTDANGVIVTSKTAGVSFDLSVAVEPPTPISPEPFIQIETTQAATPQTPDWSHCYPEAGADGFFNVRATDRLTHLQAMDLAAKTVFKSYRVVNMDVAMGFTVEKVVVLSQPQIVLITVNFPLANTSYNVTMTSAATGLQTETYTTAAGAPPLLATLYTQIASKINSSAQSLFQTVTATASAEGVEVTGKVNGVEFDMDGSAGGVNDPPSEMTVELTQEALEATQDKIAVNRNAVKGTYKPIYVPGYGTLKRKEQLVLQHTQVEQIEPQPDDKNLLDTRTGEAVNVIFYRGVSHDKPAQCFGSVLNVPRNGVIYPNAGINTDFNSLVTIPFTIDPERFLVHFSQPAYVQGDGVVQEPTLLLQTGVLVRDATTNALDCFTRLRPLGGEVSLQPLYRHFPDVQANVESVYNDDGTVFASILQDSDPITRAEYYLDAMQGEFNLGNGLIVEYNGIVAVDLDGLTWQVTWTVGPDGASTIASQNCEHATWIPPLPARRRAEYLPPVTAVNAKGERVNLTDPPK